NPHPALRPEQENSAYAARRTRRRSQPSRSSRLQPLGAVVCRKSPVRQAPVGLDCARVASPVRDNPMRIDRRLAIKLLAVPTLSSGLSVLPSRVFAQQYPTKPVRLIVPYPAGGPYDGIPRLIAQWISAREGWSIVIDNRTGAAGL